MTMRSFIVGRAVTAIVAALALASLDAAQIQVGYSGSPYGPYQTGQGGEFTLKPLDGLLGSLAYAGGAKDVGGQLGSFQTFCIEVNEHILPFNTIVNATLSDGAINGGVGGQTSPNYDPLSRGTAWLYRQFALGTLPGYDYLSAPGRHASADALQRTFWWLEGETGDPGSANPFRQAVLGKFGNDTTAMSDNQGLYPVRVLNLHYANGLGQDQLVSVPESGPTLPLLALGLGALGLQGWKGRRKSRK